MIGTVLKVVSVILLTMLKFIFGPTMSYAYGFSFLTAVVITISGTMLSVFLFTFLGNFLRNKLASLFNKKRKVFTKRHRLFVKVWKTYGIYGVAFLTPLILTPIGGTLLLSAYHTPRRQVFLYMFISATFWSILLCGIMYFAGDHVRAFIC